jgi:sugar O-acyltransferase (sialic acid O-acetyltransferase NeuD family)
VPTEIYVAGTRTFSAEVIDLALESGFSVPGLLEPADRERVGTTIHERPVTWLDDGPRGDCDRVAVGTGDISRRSVVERLIAAGWRPLTLVHPSAQVAPSARVGAGALIGAGVVIGARSTVGEHAVLGRGALVGHHTAIGARATLGPGANVAGNAIVGEEAFVAMGALVRDHVTVGPAAVVAMGSVVVGDVDPGAHVRGVPAAAYAASDRAGAGGPG